ncbi:CYTH domain-containing protein [Streptomyces sp. NPDC058953]|uniref:CYTH domain-containing protein n=1 Tax=unclassified Streptomyces TaxID=2593676 RepID=UPI003694CDE1
MIEAELKARVPAPHDIQARLDERAEGRTETYRDTYYDTQDHTLDAQGLNRLSGPRCEESARWHRN